MTDINPPEFSKKHLTKFLGSESVETEHPGMFLTPDEDHPANIYVSGPAFEGYHSILIDLDLPHSYNPSSTPGHGHLYIPTYLDYRSMVEFHEFLVDFGIEGVGYLEAIRRRGFSSLRLPGVTK